MPKYSIYMFEYIKLNNNIFLLCTECIHSCAIVCILVKLSFMFAINIVSEIAIYRLVLLFLSSFSLIFTFSFFSFFNIDLHIALFSGNLFVISSKGVFFVYSLIFFILILNTIYRTPIIIKHPIFISSF